LDEAMATETTAPGRVFAVYRLSQTRERARGLLEALRSASTVAFAESGCLASRVFVAADEPGVLLLVEEWGSAEHLEKHVRSPAFHRVLSVLELSRTPPDVVYVVGGAVRGIEWLAAARHPA
jgi:quinol monooxygenase YgiN